MPIQSTHGIPIVILGKYTSITPIFFCLYSHGIRLDKLESKHILVIYIKGPWIVFLTYFNYPKPKELWAVLLTWE